ncbi:MAG TPA: hypothetical protein VHL59_05850 [Thermoanaerobaculia bacterium]|nr:hypothetical protein [Thermoanaerobaculia bacterium]
MKTVQLAELGALAEDIRNGETIEVVDGDRPVATVTPMRKTTDEEILDEMERKGIITRGSREPLPKWFFEELPVDTGEGALEEFLADRRKNDW